jgi:hypothetical protein
VTPLVALSPTAGTPKGAGRRRFLNGRLAPSLDAFGTRQGGGPVLTLRPPGAAVLRPQAPEEDAP